MLSFHIIKGIPTFGTSPESIHQLDNSDRRKQGKRKRFNFLGTKTVLGLVLCKIPRLLLVACTLDYGRQVADWNKQ